MNFSRRVYKNTSNFTDRGTPKKKTMSLKSKGLNKKQKFDFRSLQSFVLFFTLSLLFSFFSFFVFIFQFIFFIFGKVSSNGGKKKKSRELLALCLKKINGLKWVKLVDAQFIWTEVKFLFFFSCCLDFIGKLSKDIYIYIWEFFRKIECNKKKKKEETLLLSI